MEERILKKIREELIFEIYLMKSDMIAEILSALGDALRHVGTKDLYEEVFEDFEFFGSSGEIIIDHLERPIGARASQFTRLRSQLKLKHKMEVSKFSSTLTLEDLIDSICELEDYFELEGTEDSLILRFIQTKLKVHTTFGGKNYKERKKRKVK